MGRGKRFSPLQKKINLHSESFRIFGVQIFFEKSRNCPKKVTTNGFKCDIIHTSGTNKDFCTLLLNCLNCVLFVILWCLLLFCLILFWFLKLCDVFIIPLYCVPESRSHFFTAVLFELRYLFLCIT